MVAKLAKICTLRISPQTLNFILSDKVAGGGVSMWCELEQVRRAQPEAGAASRGLQRLHWPPVFLPTGELLQ